MSTLRDNCTPLELRAHALLDSVREGLYVDAKDVRWALLVLGDL